MVYRSREKLLEERRKLIDSIFWGMPWNQRKVKEIDASLYNIDQFMYTMARLGFHKDYPYWNCVETHTLMMKILRETADWED